MSKAAIKHFFDNEREVTARLDAYYKRMEEEMSKPRQEIVKTNAVDKDVAYFDFILKRNWFLDDESVVFFLMDATEEVFRAIVRRADTYPANIREAIYSFLPISTGKVTMKLRDLTDDQMDVREFREQERLRKDLSDAWEAHKVEKNLEPPVGNLDAELDDLFTYLQQLKKDLEDAKKKSLAGRYVPPAIRDKIATEDPRVIEVAKKIETVENEIIRQNRYIEQEKDGWFMQKRYEFEQTMLPV